VFDAARQAIGAEVGFVALLTPEGNENEFRVMELGGQPCRVDARRPKTISGMRAETYRTNRVVVRNDLGPDPGAGGPGGLPEGHVPLRSVLLAPIALEGEVVGQLGLGNQPGGFADRDAELAAAFGELLAVSLRNSRQLASLRDGERQAREIYELLPVPTYLYRRQAGALALSALNQAARGEDPERADALLGAPPEQVHGTLPDLQAALQRCLERREVVHGAVRAPARGGRPERHLSYSCGPLGAEAVILHLEDVTRQRQTEEQLRVSQRMEAVGRLAGGVAHDFNNLLTVIGSNVGFALADLRPGDPLQEDLQEVRTATDRAASLTRQLLAFSRRQILEPVVVDLDQAVAGMAAMLRRLIGEDIDLVVSPGSTPVLTRVDPGQLEQVLMNLVINARDAMADGGRLLLETGVVALDASYAEQHPEVVPGAYAVLTVTDTGIGMDEATRLRIFEPFFTTKGPHVGSGLGLATVYGIVKQSGGSIGVYSEPGQGTTFKVYLPQAAVAARPGARPTPLALVRGGTETVLIVEDEDAVRRLARRMLAQHGYHVLQAANGGEALLLCEQHAGEIHLLLTDVVMPLMSGRQLADRLRRLRPDLRVLYMSGYTDNAIVHHGVLDADAWFIGKPFSQESLAAKVREVLDAPPRR
jgi:signal transduction histidine kinase